MAKAIRKTAVLRLSAGAIKTANSIKTASSIKTAGSRKYDGPRPADAALDYAGHFHGAPSGYLILSPDGSILDVNETLAAWTGYRREKLLGSDVVELMPKAVQVLFASYVLPQLAVAGSFHELVADLLCKNGEHFSVLLSAVRSDHPDGTGTIDRITAVKASERRLRERELVANLEKAEAAEAARAEVEAELREKNRALEEKNRLLQESLAEKTTEKTLLETVLNASGAGLLVVDVQGTTVLANDYLSSTLQPVMGLQPGSETDEVFAADRVTPLPAAENPVLRASGGKSFTDQQLWFGTGDNQMAVSASASPIKANGALSGAVITFSEVTRLARAVAVQEEFNANLSHELGTPLISLKGYLDLVLADSGLAPHIRSALDVAVRSSERLLAFVSSVTAVPPASIRQQRRPVNLAEAVRSGITSARAKAHDVDFLTDVPVSAVVHVDPQRFTQAIGNLLSNAVKSSPAGGTVYVHLWQQGQAVCLRIADTGMGTADPDAAPAKPPRTRRTASAAPAAGLAASRSIIEEHGGELSFVSNPGEGSVCRVILPVSAEMAALNR